MAKAQNTFIKSRMNKDLDDRILSKGEYRDAQNINVSKSEGADVGALENVLGNLNINSFTSSVDGAVIIGNLMDYTNDRIYVFITNYTDSSPNSLNNYAPAGAYCAISVYEINTGQSHELVKGSFLNFSTTHVINGVNLIEELLFFTDNRNQPRKINVNLAITAVQGNATAYHYTTEDQISLAKYYPYKAPQLYSNFTVKSAPSSAGTVTPTAGSVTTSNGVAEGITSIPVNAFTTNVFVGMNITGTNISPNTVINEVIVNQNTNTTTLVISNPVAAGGIVNGASLATVWELTNANANIKAGMYIVLSGNNSSSNPQSQNIRISSTGTTTFTVDSTAPDDKVWANQSINIYYPTSYTKSENHIAPSLVGVVSSGNGFETDDDPKGGQSSNTQFQIYCNGTPRVGMLLTSSVGGQGGTTFSSKDMAGFLPGTTISSVSGTSNPFTITTSRRFNAGTLLKSTQILLSDPNPYYDSDWPGDKDLLKEKFVRFSYRFKYEDGEYSLIAPFTQPAFIPKQDGYLSSGVTVNSVFNKTTAEDTEGFTNGTPQYESYFFGKIKSQEDDISSSTIVEFFENRVQEVDINIPCEYIISSLNNNLKVIEIDILYKESDALVVKILDTLSYTDSEILNNHTKTIIYNYQSRKPFKNLSERQTVRVYDKIPVRAKTQSVTGNRVVFGNFIDKPTPPLTLDYSVGVSDKFRLDSIYSNYSSAAAYVNHSVKQNRNYQIGLVLQDKYGRSSDVVLSSLGINKQEFPAGSGELFSGSTIFHNYRLTEENIYNWFGDSIKILFNNPIPETVTYANGYPGIYRSGFIEAVAENDGANKFLLTGWNDDIIVGSLVQGIDSSAVSFSEAITAIDAVNEKITLSNDVSINSSTAITIIGNANPLGWYSYKVVVKQEAEDYYNAYLPNALSGNTQYSIPLSANISFLTLTGDNINKIPADLTDVAPEQTQFRTSDIVLYPRVNARGWESKSSQINVSAGENPTRSNFFTIDSIAKLTDMGINTNREGVRLGEAPKASGIYDAASDPTLAKLSTYGTMFGGWFNNEVFTTDFNQPFSPYNPPYSVNGSFNTDSAITGSRTLSDAPVINGEPVDGCIYPRINTVWQNETEFSKDDPGFLGLITIGKEIPSSWGEWSHPKTSSPGVLLLNYIPAIDTSTNVNNQTSSVTGCWKAPYNPFAYYTKLQATLNNTTGSLEVELTQDNTSPLAANSFQSTGSGTGAKIKIIATEANVSSGYRIYSDMTSSPRYSNTRILVTDGGTGYAAGDTFTIDPDNVTGLSLRAGETPGSGNIVITIKAWLFDRPSGVNVQALTGEGSGLRLRGVNVGPWFPSGKFDKSFSQYTQEKTGDINNMYWQVTQLGTGYKAGDKISIPAWPEDSVNIAPFEGTFWTDRMVMTLRERDLRQVNLNNPTPVSVMEVKPNNSDLDIYWETSTVGLISELNKTINDASSASRPNTLGFETLGVAKTQVFFPETAGPNSAISQFKTLSQNGVVLDNATFSNLYVTNSSDTDISSYFTLSNQVVSNVNFGIIKPSPRAFSQTIANNNFTFSVRAVNIAAGITYENNFTFNGALANEIPTIVDSGFVTVTGVQSSTSSGGDVFFNIYAINGAYKSVAGQELNWTAIGNRESPFSFENGAGGTIEFAPSPNTDRQRSKQEIKFTASGLGDGVYNETIGVTDAGGSGLSSTTVTLKVTVTLPPPPPPPPGENS
tara:strand:+ start:4077 stop:9191 length:5115 start_codon:yes stop_codon:yes gene_type:complete